MKLFGLVFSSIFLLSLFFSNRLIAFDLNQINLSTLNKDSALKLFQDRNIAYPKPNMNFAIEAQDKKEPIIITVAGLSFGEIGCGKLELKYLLNIINFFFPKKDYNDNLLRAEVDDFNKDYFFYEENEPAEIYIENFRVPDNYIEVKLREDAKNSGYNITIIPFPWSRDPEDTKETVKQFQEKMIEVHRKYKDTGRPIHILAHSWGTVLMHETLHRLAKSNPEINIDKFITTGSPLMPANLIVNLFTKIKIFKEDIENRISKPTNVKIWGNLWAKHDMFSNIIKSSDENIQIDSEIENFEPLLMDMILNNKPLKKMAKTDLRNMRNTKAWHGAYIFDYAAKFNSINKEVSISIFKPLVIPHTIR
ncbi:MAG: hypothetical protein L6420_05725 [Elusimicrobia bacterium]|nr:hypothetical protein [Elusimicrobiota bacterium]